MATFKSKMQKLDPSWPDKIWAEIMAGNRSGPRESPERYAQWVIAGRPSRPLSIMLPVAALALTGVRPISLERGIVFKKTVEKDGTEFLDAISQGAKIIRDDNGELLRGQEEVTMRWRLTPPQQLSHRRKEMLAIAKAVLASPDKSITITYNAESISTRLREISKRLWPRRRYHVSGVCYRELLSSTSKDADVDPVELAAAMGHLSAKSQQKYHRRTRTKGHAERETKNKPFSSATATVTPRPVEKPIDRIAKSKKATAVKVAKER